METSLEVKESSQSIFACSPQDTILFATKIANALAPVVDRQNMYVLIQGKKYVKVEAWLTLGAMVGITPRESEVKELPDGSFEARVDLLNQSGRVVGGASALCGIEEPRWKKADRFSRRSMAVTRATAKAYRIAFSWVILLAGYQPTPAEEMEHVEIREERNKVHEPRGFNPENPTHVAKVSNALEEAKIPGELWQSIMEQMRGRGFAELGDVVARFVT